MKHAFVLAALVTSFALPGVARAEEGAPEPAHASPLRMRGFAGLTHGALFGMPVTGPSGGGSFGGGMRTSWGGVEGFGDLTYDALKTEHGIGVHRLALGATCEVFVWRIRSGLGWDLGNAWIRRVSGSNESANRVYVGLHATLGVDLFTARGFTPYVQARGDLNTAFPSLGANAGLRYAF